MLAGLVSFFAVLFNIVATGQAKVGTLLVAADLFVSGFSATASSENEAQEGGEAE